MKKYILPFIFVCFAAISAYSQQLELAHLNNSKGLPNNQAESTFKSWWAYAVYFILIIFLIRLFVKYQLNRQREESENMQKFLEANKLHEVDELKLKFFTNVSHEIKTPLTLIIAPLEKLMKSPIYESQKPMLDIMYKNAMNLLNMVNEILDFRKFDLNKMALNASGGDMVELTKDICRSFSSLAAEKSIKLVFTTYLQELQMDFDWEKMHKVIANLISNAFKYTDEGRIDVSIGISEVTPGADGLPVKQMALKISDTGIGIAPEYLSRIFERFFRIENAGKGSQPGTGVGLHLANEYVKLHGGEIRVESVAGKGSVFTVLLPMRSSTRKALSNQGAAHSGDVRPEATPPDVKANLKAAQRANLPLLLIIDDNEDFCDFITDLFSESYRVVAASDGEEGYKIALDQVPDIILCDVMMPKMDGYELCRKVREDIRTSHIPIILLTAKSSEENKFSGIEAGADDYISKPFNIDMLTLKMAKIIEKQKLLQSAFKKKIDVSPSEIEITSMDEKFVQKAVLIVEKNIDNPDFLVENLCKEMGMSRVYLYKKMLALTDKTPSEFIRFIRLKRAAAMLEKSQMFVNEIAFQVGFNEPKYFRKYFKEEFGVTPSEYKKKF
jgi:signal transduction histidine kinase/DNA-binding response OmpR family regulator